MESRELPGKRHGRYIASDGSAWDIEYIHPPVPDRRFDWQGTPDGYEPGDPVAYGEDQQDCIYAIEAVICEKAGARR